MRWRRIGLALGLRLRVRARREVRVCFDWFEHHIAESDCVFGGLAHAFTMCVSLLNRLEHHVTKSGSVLSGRSYSLEIRVGFLS